MTRTLDEANREISRVRGMPYGLARTQAAEQQVRVVETEGPDGARAFALSVLVDSCQWGGEVDRSFVSFARLLRWWDEHPEHFDEYDQHALFWSFKWMVSGLADFPTVPAEQIDRTLADMERRYALAGNGMDAVAYERFAWARQRGAQDVGAAYDAWVATPRDDFSQCEACDPGDRASYLISVGRLDEGIRLIERTLEDDPSCASEPADMLSILALAYLDTGRPRDAARAHRQAVAALADAMSDMAGARGRRVALLGRGGQPTRAVRAIEQDQGLLTGGDTPHDRLQFLRLVGAATTVLRRGNGDRAVRLTAVPAATVAELDEWAHAQALELAAAFDARNGTTAETDAVELAWRSEPAELPLDLDVLPTGLLPADEARVSAPAEDSSASAVASASAASTAPGQGRRDGRHAHPDAPADPLVEAEHLVAAGDLESAAAAYLLAAAQAEEAGRLVDAGFAYAEAAHCAQVLGDDDGAAAGYAAAVARLRAGGTAPVAVVPVVVAWARAAAVTGDGEGVLAEADRIRVALDVVPAQVEDPALPRDATRLAARERAAARRASADLDDAAARLLGTLGGPERLVDGAARAQRAAEAYAGVGAVADAAHAFWLAGRLHDGLGHVDEAVWNLESAMEGFEAVGRGDERVEVADVLIDVLRRSGQHTRAEELARTLSS